MDILKTAVQDFEEKDAIIEEKDAIIEEKDAIIEEFKRKEEARKTSEPQHDSGNDQEPGDSCIWRKFMFRLMIKEVGKTNGNTFPKLKLWGHPEGMKRESQSCKEGVVYKEKWYKIKDKLFSISYDFKTVYFYHEEKTNKNNTYNLTHRRRCKTKSELDISKFSITRIRILLTHMITIMNE